MSSKITYSPKTNTLQFGENPDNTVFCLSDKNMKKHQLYKILASKTPYFKVITRSVYIGESSILSEMEFVVKRSDIRGLGLSNLLNLSNDREQFVDIHGSPIQLAAFL
ncbi:MAG: hypothetical protein K1060chlam1_01125 [Candidatus Anoxychlamydiales bacterium]|nr:hypothetical protein [Candidatus Anoxychlamydiales bacterium]